MYQTGSNQLEKGISVKLRNYERFEDLIKRFKKKVTRSEILKEIRKKEFFEKPSSIKRKKKLFAIKTMNQNKKSTNKKKREDSNEFNSNW